MLDRILIGASSTETTDPDFENVTLLLHGDGSNGAQNNTFIDSSTNNFTITRNGNTTQGSFSPYGSNWSNYFDGSGDYISAPSNTSLAFGTGAYTIEAWVFVTGSNSLNALFQVDEAYEGMGIIFDYTNTRTVMKLGSSGGNQCIFSAVPSRNTWVHVAIVRTGTAANQTKMYLNGTQQGTSQQDDYNHTISAATLIGTRSGSDYFSGYISNFRVLKGTALYTSNFTPSTTPLTAITNTSLLTCAYNRFRDGSTNNFTITRNGDVKVTNFAPFAPSSAYSTSANGGSAYFDGSGDYLSVADNTALEFGSGDFTIEMWAYFVATGGAGRGLIAKGTTTGSSFLIFQGGTNELAFYASSNGSTWDIAGGNQFSSNITLNTWHHIAVTRSGTTFRLFLNGDLITSFTSSASLVNNASSVDIGTYGSGAFNGYLSNVRLVKGTAVYTAAFTPPTSPVTAITNTQLLTNFTNAAIFDNSMKNDLETVGNAQISTSVKKFGTGSMYFDGNGDYLIRYQSLDLRMGGGNFTAECWVYPTSKTGWRGIFYKGNNSNQAEYSLGWEDGVLTARLADNGSFAVTDTTTLNAWNHVAYVRNGTTFTVYINGVSQGTATSSTSFVSTQNNEPFIVGYYDFVGNLAYFQGYIDDLRITKGVARYTANFTAPTAPFPNK